MSQTAVAHKSIAHKSIAHKPVVHKSVTRPDAAEDRRAPSWLITVWAALAALAVCIVAVFYPPIEPPAAWRSAESAVVSLGRHALPEDGLSL